MTVEAAATRLQQMLHDAGFDPTHPDASLAWEVFKRFVNVPVESGGGRECEEVWFESSDGDSEKNWPGSFDFVRMFNHYTDNDAVWHEMVTAQFESPPEARLGLRGSIHADLRDLPAFFRKVEGSEPFRAGLGYAGWSFKVRVDCS